MRKVFVRLALVGLALVLLLGLLTLIFFDPTCEGDDAEAIFARSLSDARLEQIFADIRSRSPWARNLFQEDIPETLSDLGLVGIRTYMEPGEVTLRFRGCMDHHLDLVVYGADGPHRGGSRIVLRYGEGEGSGIEVLWQPNSDENDSQWSTSVVRRITRYYTRRTPDESVSDFAISTL